MTRYLRTLPAALLVGAAMVLGGCSGPGVSPTPSAGTPAATGTLASGPTSTRPPAPATASTASPPVSPSATQRVTGCAPPTTLTTQAGLPPVGRSFAFVRHFDGVDLYVEPAVFLTGREANQAAREDGVIDGDDTVPNDYYIRSDDTVVLRVPVAPGFEAEVIDREPGDRQSLTSDALASLYCPGAKLPALMHPATRLPAHITLEGGLVTRVEQLYLP